MSQKESKVPEQAPNNVFELLDAKQLAERLGIPVSWVRNHSSASSATG